MGGARAPAATFDLTSSILGFQESIQQLLCRNSRRRRHSERSRGRTKFEGRSLSKRLFFFFFRTAGSHHFVASVAGRGWSGGWGGLHCL